MRAFVSVIFVACFVSYLNAAAVEVVKSDDKSVQSDVKQEKRSLSHGTIETSPIQITSAGAAAPSYDQGWATQSEAWPRAEAGWAPAPQAPVFSQGPQIVATNTDTLTTIQQKVPVPYPVFKTVQVDRPVPQPYPVEVIKHVPQPYPVVK
jgi:hypothetical protein